MNARRLDQAITVAREYARLSARGDATLAEQAARTIDDLVGRWQWIAGRYAMRWPAAVRSAAGVLS